MNLKIKLKNHKQCNGCPLATKTEVMFPGNHLATVCQLGYWIKQIKTRTCPSYIEGLFTYIDISTRKLWNSKKDPYMLNTETIINRPKKCIEENGK